MLKLLSIRDVVLIEALDLTFEEGLTVFSGETGAGKSILLDSLGLILGDRATAGLIRKGAQQAQVSAEFDIPPQHPLISTLIEHGIIAEFTQDPIVIRRIITQDGRSRAFVNDSLVSVQLLKLIGSTLIDIQGQHGQTALAEAGKHLELLDTFGDLSALCLQVGVSYRDWQTKMAELLSAQTALKESLEEEEWLRSAVEELERLSPHPEEEAILSAQRQHMLQAEKKIQTINDALKEIAPEDRRAVAPSTAIYNASRTLSRLVNTEESVSLTTDETLAAPFPLQEVLNTLEQAQDLLAEAENTLTHMMTDAETDPKLLEQTEERLFALRAAARKHNTGTVELPTLLKQLQDRLELLDTGSAHIEHLKAEVNQTRLDYCKLADTLSKARKKAAEKLEKALIAELKPLKLERTHFVVSFTPLSEKDWGPKGQEYVNFLISTNAGLAPAPLAKVASGGELSRLLLAIKVVVARQSAIPTLIFDEIDSGVGGATASAIGERLYKIARSVQVLAVTHSPQVAARADHHFYISKTMTEKNTETQAQLLSQENRIEELARMLSGKQITAEARTAALSLIEKSQND